MKGGVLSTQKRWSTASYYSLYQLKLYHLSYKLQANIKKNDYYIKKLKLCTLYKSLAFLY